MCVYKIVINTMVLVLNRNMGGGGVEGTITPTLKNVWCP